MSTSGARTSGSEDLPQSTPVLREAQLVVLRHYGAEQRTQAGDVLYAEGDESYDLLVVLDGEVQVVERFGQPDQALITVLGAGEFAGDISILTGQHAYQTAVVSRPGQVLRVAFSRLQEVMAQEPDLSELILRAFLLRHSLLTQRGSGLTLVGSRFDRRTHELLETLARNRLPSMWLELENSPEAEEVIRQLDIRSTELPIVRLPGGQVLRRPTHRKLLQELGLATPADGPGEEAPECDLLILGSGPAGLAAAVNGASEGLHTRVAEATALGGQAGTTTRIENYLGFPAGLSGEELTTRAVLQARKFGAKIMQASRAIALEPIPECYRVSFESGEVVSAQSIIVATGAHYNRLQLDRLDDLEGAGVYYAATQHEAQACAGDAVVVVGGGNSAGQAALFLSRYAARVHLVARSQDLARSMSWYLIDQIKRHGQISTHTRTEVSALLGEPALDGVELRDNPTGERFVVPAAGLFIFIGATPHTDCLGDQVATDDRGFVVTGADVPKPETPAPLPLETSLPGVFCAGDVRSKSVKRVATAIGEGAMAVRLVFDRLEATARARRHGQSRQVDLEVD
jgi:thioredoxin reductase (NADPH)